LRRFTDDRKNRPCADCSEVRPPEAMDFDHLSDDKVDSISALVSSLCSVEKLEAEITKCEVVCANCHRVRTWTRQRTELSEAA
jgi:hypothetical protein